MDLKAETPASSIAKLAPDTYKINCMCTASSHDIMMFVEKEADGPHAYELYFEMRGTPSKEYLRIDYDSWWLVVAVKHCANTFMSRISACMDILWCGQIKTEASVLLDAQAAKNLAAILDHHNNAKDS